MAVEVVHAHPENARVEPLDVPFLGRAALIRNKRAAGRPKDVVDADALEHVGPTKNSAAHKE